MESKKERLKSCLVQHSKNGNITVDRHKDKLIYQFDLTIDDSENKWGELQPKVSAVSVRDNMVESYNIRIGEVSSEDAVTDIEDCVVRSRPPCLDKFDTGHSESVIQPHIRMSDEYCSIDEFIDFMNRLMTRLSQSAYPLVVLPQL